MVAWRGVARLFLVCEVLMESRYKTGGLEPRFIIERADGKPIPSDRRYSLVLDFSGVDPHARVAALVYASLVGEENPQLEADIKAALDNPSAAPPQHRYA
jgi:hypothetical protein